MVEEDTGWKLLHGDVFRAPLHPNVLAVSVGIGVQFTLASTLVLMLGAFGFLRPNDTAAVLNCFLSTY